MLLSLKIIPDYLILKQNRIDCLCTLICFSTFKDTTNVMLPCICIILFILHKGACMILNYFLFFVIFFSTLKVILHKTFPSKCANGLLKKNTKAKLQVLAGKYLEKKVKNSILLALVLTFDENNCLLQ